MRPFPQTRHLGLCLLFVFLQEGWGSKLLLFLGGGFAGGLVAALVCGIIRATWLLPLCLWSKVCLGWAGVFSWKWGSFGGVIWGQVREGLSQCGGVTLVLKGLI